MERKFCGVWGQLREEYLKEHEPELYKSLIETNELEKYLEVIRDFTRIVQKNLQRNCPKNAA